MRFTPASLLTQLMQLPVPRRYCVAFSGGVDSHVLLHALVQVREQLPCSELHAIHVNHGIHPDAGQWARHCEFICRELGVSIEIGELQLQRQAGQSLEASAREARYQVWAQLMREGDMLLLAHHQDDQAETLLLQLMRGSGVKGLAGMPACTTFAQGWLARPLLQQDREALLQYAIGVQLPWIEDPSNMDTAFDRNFLRHVVVPLLRQRWPSLGMTLARSAQHQADAAVLLDSLAQHDLVALIDDESRALQLPPLRQLDPVRQRNVVRYWLHQVCGLPLPGSAQLQRILDEVLPAAEDAAPLVHWPGGEVRRYRDALYAMAPHAAVDTAWQAAWDMRANLHLPTGDALQAQSCAGTGLRMSMLEQGVTVRLRQGGERCRLPGRTHHHDLKKLLQDWGVPPWQRNRIPLVYVGEELAQVVGFCVCAPFVASPGEEGVEIIAKAPDTAIETTGENKDNSPGCTP